MVNTRFKKTTQEWVLKNRNKQKLNVSSCAERQCRNCLHFNDSLVDLRNVGRGECRAYPPFPFFIKTKGHTTYMSEFPEVRKINVCGQFKSKK